MMAAEDCGEQHWLGNSQNNSWSALSGIAIPNAKWQCKRHHYLTAGLQNSHQREPHIKLVSVYITVAPPTYIRLQNINVLYIIDYCFNNNVNSGISYRKCLHKKSAKAAAALMIWQQFTNKLEIPALEMLWVLVWDEPLIEGLGTQR